MRLCGGCAEVFYQILFSHQNITSSSRSLTDTHLAVLPLRILVTPYRNPIHTYTLPSTSDTPSPNHPSDRLACRLIEQRVKKLMAERGDYKAWYYTPHITRKYQRIVRKETEELMERRAV